MNIIQTLTDRIIASLESGKAPWHKTWQGGLPASLSTGREYRGINIFLLGTQEFSSRYWVTFREALRLGGHVRKGEKATPIVYWKWRTPEEIAKADREGRRTPPCHPFISHVFNLDQVEGVARPETDVHHEPHRRLEIADLMLEMMPSKPEIQHALSFSPCYISDFDRIQLPHLSQFTSAENYFSVLFHELIHSTGHPRRLNRLAQDTGNRSERYSFEELVAEFGAAFLCAFCGIRTAQVEALQTSYITGWATVFRKDPMVLLRAASAAQKAADFIRGKVVPDVRDVETSTSTESVGAVA